MVRCIVLLTILFIGFLSTNAEENNPNSAAATQSNVENLKILRKSVTFAYTCGNEFLNLIRGSKQPDKFLIRIMKMNEEPVTLNEIVKTFLPYIGYTSLIIFGLIFVIFVPIVGFCFCLCRCGGKCGGRVRGMDPKHARCKRYTYAIMLGIISVVMLAGLVLSFINNQLIHDTLTNPSPEINAIKQIEIGNQLMLKSVRNITTSIDSTENNNFKKDNRNKSIDSSDLLTKSIESFYFTLKNLMHNDLDITSKLRDCSIKLANAINFLERNKQPNNKLDKLKNQLNEEIRQLSFENVKSDIKTLLEKELSNQIQELKNQMKVQDKTTSTSKLLRKIFSDIKQTPLGLFDRIPEVIKSNVKMDYLDYRMYAFIGICCFLLLVVLFYFLGLCFGQCGERPFEDARICNRGVGANLMMAGVAFAFLITPSIMIFEMLMFVASAPIQTELCRYATNQYPPGPQVLDNFFSIYKSKVPDKQVQNVHPTLFNSIINRCGNESMVDAFDISDSLMTYEIISKISDISKNIAIIKEAGKVRIVEKYLGDIVKTLNNITKEIDKSKDSYNGFDQSTKMAIREKFEAVLTSIQQFESLKITDQFVSFFNRAGMGGFKTALGQQVNSEFYRVDVEPYKNIRCESLRNATNVIIEANCITVLQPLMGYWIGIGICLIFTVPALIFAVKLAGLYRCTEKYSSDYEEPDYNSYMGFYTNNADNIPMKRPKSSKSGQKGSNNKDMKQNNPQYLPVYSYDAYE